MLGTFKFNFILLYIIIGFAIAYVGVYLFRRHYLGRIWGAIIISVIGSFLGALVSSIFLSSSMNGMNISAAILMGSLSLFVYGKASKYHHD